MPWHAGAGSTWALCFNFSSLFQRSLLLRMFCWRWNLVEGENCGGGIGARGLWTASVPNVQTVQFESTFSSRWRTAGAGQHVNIDIIGYADFRDVRLNSFQLTSGHLP